MEIHVNSQLFDFWRVCYQFNCIWKETRVQFFSENLKHFWNNNKRKKKIELCGNRSQTKIKVKNLNNWYENSTCSDRSFFFEVQQTNVFRLNLPFSELNQTIERHISVNIDCILWRFDVFEFIEFILLWSESNYLLGRIIL